MPDDKPDDTAKAEAAEETGDPEPLRPDPGKAVKGGREGDRTDERHGRQG